MRPIQIGLRASLAAAVALALSACGFQPLYGTDSTPAGMVQYFEQVFVEPIPGRNGVVLRNQLLDAFTPGGTPSASAYRLKVVLEEKKEGLAIQEDTAITRYNYMLVARFELRDATTNDIMHRGETRAIAAYDVVDSQFATLTAQRDAEERASREIGEDIRIRLAVFFERKFGTGPRPG